MERATAQIFARLFGGSQFVVRFLRIAQIPTSGRERNTFCEEMWIEPAKSGMGIGFFIDMSHQKQINPYMFLNAAPVRMEPPPIKRPQTIYAPTPDAL